jgi:hypothetical protein
MKNYGHDQDNLPEHVSRLDATSEQCLTKRNVYPMPQPILV